MSYFCHQDALMWHWFYIMAVVQTAALGAAYAARQDKYVCAGVLILGAVMTAVLFLVSKRSEAYRDAIGKKWLSGRTICVPRKLSAPLRGKEAALVIFILCIVADILLLVEVFCRLTGLLR